MAGFTARQREDGYFICEYIDERGNLAFKTGPSADIAIAKVLKHIETYGGREIGSGGRGKRGPYGPRQRTGGERWGRPTNASIKARYDNKKMLEQVFGEIRARSVMAASAAASAANAKISEEAAKTVLKNVYKNRGKYNTYTGNLERAYMVTIVQGRNVKKTLFLDNTPEGNAPIERNGKKIVYMFKKRHELKNIRENQFKLYMRRKKDSRLKPKEYSRQPYRYFKNWERVDGYRRKSLATGRDRISGFGYMAGDKHNRVQSGIIIENTAPYAGAVQAKGYHVLPTGAMMRSYAARGKQEAMAMAITKKMLQAAKLI